MSPALCVGGWGFWEKVKFMLSFCYALAKNKT
jgi:hypothetical protein